MIRKALKSDCPLILKLIKELAIYEKAPDAVTIDLKTLEQDGFGNDPLYQSIILEKDAVPVGFALFYYRYSTWKGRSLYLEDLFVLPKYRNHGLGMQTMKYLANLAKEMKCGRFEWQVLNWNEPSIEFYKKIGADLDPEWINCRLEGEKIALLS